MKYQKVLARQWQVQVDAHIEPAADLWRLCQLVWQLDQQLEALPQVLQGQESVWVYWPGGCADCDDLLSQYDLAAALISQHYPLRFCGSTDWGEPADISATWAPDWHGISYQTRTVTGQDFDTLCDICLCIAVPDRVAGQQIASMLIGIHPGCDLLALPRTPFLEEELGSCGPRDTDSYFRYLPLCDGAGTENWQQALSVLQRQELWLAFLQDGDDPAEFGWALAALGDSCPDFGWYLALTTAMDRAGVYTQTDGKTGFHLYRGGQRLALDYQRGTDAQRFLLRALFPIAG